MAPPRNAFIFDLLVYFNDIVQWNVSFVRNVHDGELDEVANFFIFLYSLDIEGNERDIIIWTAMDSKTFSFRSYYKVLTAHHSTSFS